MDEFPRLVGRGPSECSSSTSLLRLPVVCHDVNGYYRELGVPWTASRKDLRLAYQSLDGQASPRLTYILKQLLAPDVRFAYDCTPLGDVFMDEYVHQAIMRKVREAASRRMAEYAEQGFEVSAASLERDLLSAMGWVIDGDDTPIAESLDSVPLSSKDESVPATFPYSYYLWGTSSGGAWEGHLIEWQNHLIQALSRLGVTTRFAVGLHAKPHRWIVGRVGYRTVFFLQQGESSSEHLAHIAASTFLEEQPDTPRNHREILL